jgi:hypothetical protein
MYHAHMFIEKRHHLDVDGVLLASLADIALLANADVHVGSFYSNFRRFAFQMAPAHSVAYASFDTAWCTYPTLHTIHYTHTLCLHSRCIYPTCLYCDDSNVHLQMLRQVFVFIYLVLYALLHSYILYILTHTCTHSSHSPMHSPTCRQITWTSGMHIPPASPQIKRIVEVRVL